jgi:hypothetical protein
MSPRYHTVFFDVGGTLLRVHPSVGAVYARIAARHGLELDVAEVERAVRKNFWRASKAATDPFAATGGAGFITFRFELESLRAGTLVFDAGSCRLVTQDKTTRYPLDLPTIESTYGLHGREIPPAYLTVRGALFDGTVFLEQGQRVEGLLVFQNVPPRTRAFSVEVVLTTQNGDQGRFTATYKRARQRG